MLFQGLTLTIVGMSVVFIFLALLVLSMKLLSVILRYFPEQSAAGGPLKATSKSNIEQESVLPASANEEIAAAIAAVTAFKKK